MHIFYGILSILVAVASCSSIPTIGKLGAQSSEVPLTKFMLQQTHSQADPAISTQCFAKYLPQLQVVANQWSTDYNACVNNATTDRSTVMTNVKQQQEAIAAAASAVTTSIANCQTIDDALEFFNCFTTLGKGVLSSIYTMTNNASDDAVSMQQQLEEIDATMYQCTNATERVYIQSSANIYDELNTCLEHGLPDAGSTSTPEAPTDAPANAPTTVAPPAPTSTEAPDVPVTDAPTAASTTLTPAKTGDPTS